MATKKTKKTEKVRKVAPLVRELRKLVNEQQRTTADIARLVQRVQARADVLDAAQAFISVSIEDDSE